MHRVIEDNDGMSSMMGFGEEVNQFDDLTSQGTFFERDDMKKNNLQLKAQNTKDFE